LYPPLSIYPPIVKGLGDGGVFKRLFGNNCDDFDDFDECDDLDEFNDSSSFQRASARSH
jgi:hypothetical protein